MPKDYSEIRKDISEYMKEMSGETPEVMKAFGTMVSEATKDGALDFKTKELIALAIGVSQRCDGCIGFHTKKLKDAGATRAEVAEMLAVCAFMGGGPVIMYAADALRAFDDLD